jgi:hypothetical protein
MHVDALMTGSNYAASSTTVTRDRRLAPVILSDPTNDKAVMRINGYY